YPYRRAPPAADSRPDLGTYSSSDRYRPSADHDFYRQPHEPPSHLASSSSSYPSSSSSRASGELSFSAVRPDCALSLLSSCGLEPDDLAVLAELPEDVLTVESLPRLLQEIKGKKGASEPYPSSSSRPAGSTRLPTARPSGEWDHLRSRPVQYPLDHAFITPKPLPPEQVQDWQDRWGNPRKTSAGSYKPSSSAEPPPLSSPSPSPSSSSFSNYVVDYDHRGRPTEYGKKGRDGGAVSRYDRPSSSSAAAGSGDRKPSRFSQPGSADYRFAPPEEYRPKARAERRESDTSYNKKSGGGGGSGSRLNAALKMPSKKAALDFHGTSPTTFPYSCSLCDITVLSEKFWVQHINAPQHADRQLNLLQLFPDWDCRLETAGRDDHQPEKPKDEGTPAQQPQTASQTASSYPQPNKKQKKKSGGNSKVVCVKFPAHSVDEQHLRKLTEPFGKIVKVIMFPSLAFVELGSSDQAKDLVKYYTSSPSSVQGENITFYISNTFNFLQSSRVLSFTPAPSGDDGHSDLLSIAKRFGSPLYTLFLPSMAFVELKNAADAQKLVDYYSTNILRINSDIIKVTYSGEYNTLMRVSSAKKYEEESSPTKRTRSPSPRRRDEPASSKRRRRSGEREEKEVKREGSERRTRSRSSDKSSDRSSRDSRSREKTVEPDKTLQIKTESKADEPAAPSSSKPETSQKAPIKEEAVSSGEESDIEGMEVIGEDGENLEDQDMEILDNTEEEEEEEEEEDAAEEDGPAETTDSPERVPEQEKEMKRKEAGDQEKTVKEEEEKEQQEGERREEGPEEEATSCIKMEEEEPETSGEPVENAETEPEEDEEEPDFPVDLENCITLDELEEDESDDQDGKDRDEPKSPSSRVIYLRNLPRRFYTDSDFVKVMKGFGKVARYFLIRNRQEGFIEMCSSSEALRAVKKFNCKPVELNGSKLNAQISHKYPRLTVAWKVQSDCESDEEQRSECRSRGGRRSSKSKTSERDESGRKSSEGEEMSKKSAERKESAKRTPEKEIVAKKTPEKEIVAKKTLEKEIVAKKTLEKEELTAKKTLEKEIVAEKIVEKDLARKKTPEKELVTKKTLQKEELAAKKTTEKDLAAEKTLEKEIARKKTPEKEIVAEKTLEKEELTAKKTLEKESAAKKTTEKDLAAEKTLEKELARKKTPEKELVKTTPENETLLTPEKELEAKKTCEKTESSAEKTPEKAESAKQTAEDEETPEAKAVSPEEAEMEDPEPERIRDEATEEAEEEQQPEPAGGAVEPHKPTKPVGAEFVRPVVGYFCNLCQVIYADEDEAKQQHCSSLEHYRRYQEHTGKDPWTS
ncbi:matrin 3-like 1.1, partial [Centroberyx affinis]|uniref:matrin 3-like 1.1 n=1 Tax=Centroberyx affinis TaxID=166261 RepID=UPI003A5BBD8C